MEKDKEIDEIIEHLREKGLNSSREEVKALLEKRRTYPRLYQTGHQDYTISKKMCSDCDGQHTVQGEYWADGKLHKDKICTLIVMPILKRIAQPKEMLDKKVKDLCPHAGEVREVQNISRGYIPGPYVTCQRPEQSKPE